MIFIWNSARANLLTSLDSSFFIGRMWDWLGQVISRSFPALKFYAFGFPQALSPVSSRRVNIRNNSWNQPNFINTGNLAFQVDLGIKGNKQIKPVVTSPNSRTASVLVNLQNLSSKPSASRSSWVAESVKCPT